MGDPSAASWGLDAHSGATTHSLTWTQRLGTHKAELCEKGAFKGRLHISWGSHHLLVVPRAKAVDRSRAGAANGCGSHRHAGPQMGSSNLPPKKKNPVSEIHPIAVFPFLSTQKEVRRPEAASLGMQREQDPGSWLHLLHRHQQAAFSANSSDGSSE